MPTNETKAPTREEARESAREFYRRSPDATVANFCAWINKQSPEWIEEHAGQLVAFRSDTDVVVARPGEEIADLVPEDQQQWYLLGGVPGVTRFRRREHLEAKLALALEHLRALCDEAENGDHCRMCGEDFNDNRVIERPKCPVPPARDFLTDPDGVADAVVRATKVR